MTQTPDKAAALSGLCAVNNALSFGTQVVIESMSNRDPKQRRVPDFALLDRATAAAEALVAAFGPDTPVPGAGDTAAWLLASVRGVAERAAPYRPKERRA